MTEQDFIAAAAGRVPAELVLKNAQVLNVFTDQFITADVAVSDGRIAGVGHYEGEKEIDCTGCYLVPGFTDAHLHIESSMVTPEEFVRAVLPTGTTTLIADPHEIVNVIGAPAMGYLLERADSLPVNLYYMQPSCVPCSPFETAGADFTQEQMEAFWENPHVLGLGEVMSFPAVVGGDPGVLGKIAAAKHAGKRVDGHAPGLSGQSVQAYAAAGIETDHECGTFEEAREKLMAGMAILVREGSAAKNLDALVEGILASQTPTGRFLFCTDDKHLSDIYEQGHIRWNVERAIRLGMDPVQAIKMASYNAAVAYGLTSRGIGAIAPGYQADLIVLDDLEKVRIRQVYKNGVPAQEAVAGISKPEAPEEFLHSVIFDDVTVEKIALRISSAGNGETEAAVNQETAGTEGAADQASVVEDGSADQVRGVTDVIGMEPGSIVTKHLKESVAVRDGFFVPDETYSKLCVVERHGRNGNIAVCPMKGYSIRGGAVATSVAHDSHNVIAAGDNDEDLVLAINTLKEIDGGYVLTGGGRVIATLPLRLAGLMSLESGEETARRIAAIEEKARAMGVPEGIDPFISLSFMALPVIPSLRLTDMGLFDADRFALIPQ
ncbi:MAG: adenine deaminase [Eubacteriales bacterium]|nr:adenine deaminase [Eubacteriales bacterium]